MTVYLDTSSLVKIYVSEPESAEVRRLVDEAAVVATSAVAYPEARAAFARRAREKALTAADFRIAKRDLDRDWPRYLAIEATTELCRVAGELAGRYHLRGFDSVHLASFLEVARRAGPREIQFSSYDDRLNRAALAALRRMSRHAGGAD